MRFARIVATFACVIGGLTFAAWQPASPEEPVAAKQAQVKIGMIRSIFRDTDAEAALALMQPFGELLRVQTGVGVSFTLVPDAATMGQQLKDGTIQLGVLHGIEYGWARKPFAELQPVALIYNQTTGLRAYLLVHRDNPAAKLADLKGRRLYMPRRSLNHLHLFLSQCMDECQSEPDKFFSALCRPGNVDQTLETIMDGSADAVLIDGLGFEIYRQRKPGRAARLRVLKESVSFPTAVVVHYPGRLDDDVLQRMRTGMLDANTTPLGRQLMTLWRLSGFQAVPPDYNERVQAILKVFPEPRGEFILVPTSTKVGNGK